MTGLVVEEATVSYGNTTALDRFSLEMKAGEIMAVLGPSGSGKSTLLRAVAGLEPLTSGRISLSGRDLKGVPTHRRELGMMFQDHGLFAHLDVARNIGYGLRVAGLDKTTQQSRVAELLALVGLEGFESRRTDQLSGGEAQRVALARALAPEPGLLMLDEPLGSLDRALRDQLTGDLRRMLTEIGQTALHVTHDQAEAFAIADRVAVVSEGRAVAVGPPAELWADPGTVLVARFLGHPNIWSVTVDADGCLRSGPGELGTVSEGHVLRIARYSDQHKQTVVVPVTAIRPLSGHSEDKMSFIAQVVSSVFRYGLHEVTAKSEAFGEGQTGQVNFVTITPVTPGAVIPLAVDCELIRPLSDV